jgi:hypothetical protein
LFGIIALIHGDGDAAAGVHVQQGIAHGDFHEGLDVRQRDGLLVDQQRDVRRCVVPGPVKRRARRLICVRLLCSQAGG